MTEYLGRGTRGLRACRLRSRRLHTSRRADAVPASAGLAGPNRELIEPTHLEVVQPGLALVPIPDGNPAWPCMKPAGKRKLCWLSADAEDAEPRVLSRRQP